MTHLIESRVLEDADERRVAANAADSTHQLVSVTTAKRTL